MIMSNTLAGSAAVRVVSERPLRGTLSEDVPGYPPGGPGHSSVSPGDPSSLMCWIHPEWSQRFPWLAQGTTGKSPRAGFGDFRLFDPDAGPEVEARWLEMARGQGFSGIQHARQVHGLDIHLHSDPGIGLSIGEDADGHMSSTEGVLMGVTVADCVPVFLVDPIHRAVAVLHAGWRSTAGGILQKGLRLLSEQTGTATDDLLVHLGPAICGKCYEVGPEVHTALGLPDPGGPTPVDLRDVLARCAQGMGVLSARITRSSFCTRCDISTFFSHRGGDPQRQVAFLGLRPVRNDPTK